MQQHSLLCVSALATSAALAHGDVVNLLTRGQHQTHAVAPLKI
jgi:hypothetical protein